MIFVNIFINRAILPERQVFLTNTFVNKFIILLKTDS